MRRKDREITDISDISKVLHQCKTCHIAMVDNGLPYIVPLSYGYAFDGKSLELYLHSAHEGRKIDVLKRCNKVCFEISLEGEPVNAESPCDSGYYYASVIGFGEAVFIEDAEKKCEALSIMVRHQTGRDAFFTSKHANSVCVIKIVSSEFTGKKKSRAP